jgi:hypothetical protein
MRKEGFANLTFHPALSSNPFGASARSLCPLKNPVNLRSRSITVFCELITRC